MKMKVKRVFSVILVAVIMCITFAISVSAESYRKVYISPEHTAVYSSKSLIYDTVYDSDELTVITDAGRYIKVSYLIFKGENTVCRKMGGGCYG